MSLNIKIAITAWIFGTGTTAQILAEQAELAEQLGFHSFWLPESHFIGKAAIPSPLMLLAAIASRTSQIGLGTTSYLLPIRHPIQAAEEVAVLDQLSDGRVILGVGRGFREALFTTFDIPVKAKRKRFAATLETMIKAWKGEPIAWQENSTGEKEAIYLAPLPVQRPHPPIWAAAFGPLAIQQAGAWGLPYIASPLETKEELLTNYSNHQNALTAAQHGVLKTVPIMRTVFISRNPSLIEQVRQSLKPLMRTVFISRNPSLIEQVRQSLKPPPRPVIANNQKVDIDEWALIGAPEFVAKGIARYQEKLGMTHLIVRGPVDGVEQKELIRSIELLAEIGVPG